MKKEKDLTSQFCGDCKYQYNSKFNNPFTPSTCDKYGEIKERNKKCSECLKVNGYKKGG